MWKLSCANVIFITMQISSQLSVYLSESLERTDMWRQLTTRHVVQSRLQRRQIEPNNVISINITVATASQRHLLIPEPHS